MPSTIDPHSNTPIETSIDAADPAQRAQIEAMYGASDKPYVLCKRGLFYRPRAQGYTADIAEAGRFSEAEAILHCDVKGVTRHLASSIAPASDPARGVSEAFNQFLKNCPSVKHLSECSRRDCFTAGWEAHAALSAARPQGEVSNDLLNQCAKIAGDLYGEGPSSPYDNGATSDGWDRACTKIAEEILALSAVRPQGEVTETRIKFNEGRAYAYEECAEYIAQTVKGELGLSIAQLFRGRIPPSPAQPTLESATRPQPVESRSDEASVKFLAEDTLWRLLASGKATREDQHHAARWIAWLNKYLPEDVSRQCLEGRVKFPEILSLAAAPPSQPVPTWMPELQAFCQHREPGDDALEIFPPFLTLGGLRWLVARSASHDLPPLQQEQHQS